MRYSTLKQLSAFSGRPASPGAERIRPQGWVLAPRPQPPAAPSTCNSWITTDTALQQIIATAQRPADDHHHHQYQSAYTSHPPFSNAGMHRVSAGKLGATRDKGFAPAHQAAIYRSPPPGPSPAHLWTDPDAPQPASPGHRRPWSTRYEECTGVVTHGSIVSMTAAAAAVAFPRNGKQQNGVASSNI